MTKPKSQNKALFNIFILIYILIHPYTVVYIFHFGHVLYFCSGIQLMVVVIYNYQWVTSSTGHEVVTKITTSQRAASSIIPAILNLFTFTSSLYHLLYMGIQRLHAVAWPINYKFQSKASVYQSLAAVWILAALSASLPGENTMEKSFAVFYWVIHSCTSS